jgi:aconitate hydratase
MLRGRLLSAGSFGVAGSLTAGGEVYRIFRVSAVDGAARLLYCLAAAVLPEGATGEPASQRGRAVWSLPSRSRRWPGGTRPRSRRRKSPSPDGLTQATPPLAGIDGARVLALLGDSVTTDHISPAGAIKADSPAGRYLIEHGVPPRDFNSYGSRRGNHEVMIRGTFANIRLRNLLAPGTEGGYTRHLPDGEQTTIFDAAQRYAADGVPLLVIAGQEYGSGSSRDWAAKGTALLGVRAVLAASFERIHRSNLIGMGVLPLQFAGGEDAASLGLTGEETYAVRGLAGAEEVPRTVTVTATGPGGTREFTAAVRIDTPAEAAYYRHRGILPYVLRQLASRGAR